IAPPPFAAPAPPPREGREELLAKAAALYRARYHEAALELLEKVAREFPPVDEALQGYLDATKNALLEQMRGQWSRQDQVPRPRLEPAQVMQLRLSPEGGFILWRIDGIAPIGDIVAVRGLARSTG